MVKYYANIPSIPRLIKEFPEVGWVNHAEQVRFQDIEDHKARGKGVPKKAKTPGTSKLTRTWNNIDRIIYSGQSEGGQETEGRIDK